MANNIADSETAGRLLHWLVAYRDKNGKLQTMELEAPDRAAVFRLLEAKGLSALKVEAASGKSASRRPVPKSLFFKGIIAAAVVVIGAVAEWMAISWQEGTGSAERKKGRNLSRKSQFQASGARPTNRDSRSEVSGSKLQNPKSAYDIAEEFNEKAKDFIKKAVTNETQWIVPPLDPDDPDNALRTRVCQELGSLLSIEPGEPMPPFPYSFILEDDMREAQARGEDVGEIDDGNKSFIEGLAKYKIAAKETDDEHRLAHKEKLLAAQGELLDAIDEGLSVNDTIRAAYEFRKRAYEMRTELSGLLREIAEEETDIGAFKEQLKLANEKLAEQGIKSIPLEEILPEYEEDDAVDDE